ncbi:hypothetical protein K438DRAFT_1835312 [Mycena galopus ATCC 62051]|nr:hypothetical protein K438DRAFT_1835312 [Mycena galopus ATCC 62051]
MTRDGAEMARGEMEPRIHFKITDNTNRHLSSSYLSTSRRVRRRHDTFHPTSSSSIRSIFLVIYTYATCHHLVASLRRLNPHSPTTLIPLATSQSTSSARLNLLLLPLLTTTLPLPSPRLIILHFPRALNKRAAAAVAPTTDTWTTFLLACSLLGVGGWVGTGVVGVLL